MKVAKFGGSSLSNAQQIKKVSAIIQNDGDIRIVVVSAPGTRFDDDIKVTDLLIDLYNSKSQGDAIEAPLQRVLERYQAIIVDLDLDESLVAKFDQTLRTYMDTIEDPDRLSDALKASGEDFNAQVISQYLTSIGTPARYVSPKEAGIMVSDEPGNARLLPESYDNIYKLRNQDEVLIVPGFFGYSKDGDIVTFSRGGSDISGAILASGVKADVYENYTDVSYIYSAHPGVVHQPGPVYELTYKEMRELAYSGFVIFHDEALEPVYKHQIPVMIRNTNRPDIEGTMIVAQREVDPNKPVTGIAGDDGFLSVTIEKYLLNREVGFTRRLLQIFEDFGVSIEHVPTGIDNISVILRERQLELCQVELDDILSKISEILQPEEIIVEENLSLIMVVGEGMHEGVGVLNTATEALSQSGINIRMINQGASETSMAFTINSSKEVKALNTLYDAYFRS